MEIKLMAIKYGSLKILVRRKIYIFKEFSSKNGVMSNTYYACEACVAIHMILMILDLNIEYSRISKEIKNSFRFIR
jgi:hypothetical protein